MLKVDYSTTLVFHFTISFFFFLTVEPPVKLSRPQNVPEKLESYTGEMIILETTMSRPSAEVKWRLNGREIVESSNVTMIADGLMHRLTIHSPTPEDSGKYSCDVIDDKVDFEVNVSGKIHRDFMFGLMCL